MPETFNRRRSWTVLAAICVAASIMPSVVFADSPMKLRISGRAELPIPSRTVRLRGSTGLPVIVTAIAADPMSTLIAVAGDDDRIRIVGGTTLKTLQTLSGHRDRIRTLTFAPDGSRLVSAGNDGQVIVWDCQDDFSIGQRMKGTPALARVCFDPSGGEMAAVGFDNEVYLIGRRKSGKRGSDRPVSNRPVMQCDCRDLRAVAYSEDGNLLAVAGRSGDLHLFDMDSNKMIGEHPLHNGRVSDLCFAHGSPFVISVGEDGRLVSLDTRSGKVQYRTKVTSGKLFAITVLNSQLAAVAGSDNVIRIVNLDNGKTIRSLEGHRGSIAGLAASGGYLYSGGFDATLRRWAIADLQPGEERIAETESKEQR